MAKKTVVPEHKPHGIKTTLIIIIVAIILSFLFLLLSAQKLEGAQFLAK